MTIEETGNIRTYFEDGTRMSAIYLDNPDTLVYPYTREIAKIVDSHKHDTILMYGGAGYTLPQYFVRRYPDCWVDVVEINPDATEKAKELFGLSETLEQYGRINIYHKDCRDFMRETDGTWDIIINDAFVGDWMVEVDVKDIEPHIYRDGIYVENRIIDGRNRISILI